MTEENNKIIKLLNSETVLAQSRIISKVKEKHIYIYIYIYGFVIVMVVVEFTQHDINC